MIDIKYRWEFAEDSWTLSFYSDNVGEGEWLRVGFIKWKDPSYEIIYAYAKHDQLGSKAGGCFDVGSKEESLEKAKKALHKKAMSQWETVEKAYADWARHSQESDTEIEEQENSIQCGDLITIESEGVVTRIVITYYKSSHISSDPIFIFCDAPMGQAMLGKHKGDEVVVDAPGGKIVYEIIDIIHKKYNHLRMRKKHPKKIKREF